MASPSSSSPKMGLNRHEVGSVLGMTAVFIISGDRQGIYHFLSDSIEDVLGYSPQFLLGKSCYITFHPDEIPVLLDIHRRSLTGENTACVTYMRLKHASGEYVACAVEHSTVLDRTVGTITRAENGPLTIKQRLTAREVYEVHPGSQGKYTMRKWSHVSDTPSRSPSPPPQVDVDLHAPWPKPVEPAKRTAYLIDRFTDTSRVVYVTNDVLVSSRGLINQPFYSIVKPSDRALVREHIQSVKAWTPVVRTERRSGGLGYAEFHVLKIPDLPPQGHTYPQGTDESERHMPGQEFVLVEGIFTAGSDAVICVITRIDRRKGKRDRGAGDGTDVEQRDGGGGAGGGAARVQYSPESVLEEGVLGLGLGSSGGASASTSRSQSLNVYDAGGAEGAGAGAGAGAGGGGRSMGAGGGGGGGGIEWRPTATSRRVMTSPRGGTQPPSPSSASVSVSVPVPGAGAGVGAGAGTGAGDKREWRERTGSSPVSPKSRDPQ